MVLIGVGDSVNDGLGNGVGGDGTRIDRGLRSSVGGSRTPSNSNGKGSSTFQRAMPMGGDCLGGRGELGKGRGDRDVDRGEESFGGGWGRVRRGKVNERKG